ncbi:MAG: DEAD/DEAH box helicase domain protein [Parcubacteria group bacterium GW2011_GWC2_42_13]|nr:MAG: DEAD/DEAH box helicase domain protein [Parcubacteria group bacterium GW2011_GWC2_42_13]
MKDGDIIVFDLETKKSFEEVGAKNNLALLGVSALAAYSYQQNQFFVFEEKELPYFEKLLRQAKLAVGFNIRDFDLPVFAPYTSLNLKHLNILDLLDDIVEKVGFRVGLNNLTQTTLEEAKSADALQALIWYKEGRIKEIKEYCLQDVKLTRNLFDYGRKNGHVLFVSKKTNEKITVPVFWNEVIRKIDDNSQAVLF